MLTSCQRFRSKNQSHSCSCAHFTQTQLRSKSAQLTSLKSPQMPYLCLSDAAKVWFSLVAKWAYPKRGLKIFSFAKYSKMRYRLIIFSQVDTSKLSKESFCSSICLEQNFCSFKSRSIIMEASNEIYLYVVLATNLLLLLVVSSQKSQMISTTLVRRHWKWKTQ